MTKTRVYLDHAATTPLLPEVKSYLTEIADKYFGNPSSTHAEGRASRSFIEENRKLISQHLNCNTSELFFSSSGSESNNLILKSAVQSLGIKNIVSTKIEHSCNINCFDWIRKNNLAQVHFLEVDQHGQIDYGQLEDVLKSIHEKTLVSLMHINNELGTELDLEKVASVCKSHGALFHSDTVQGICFSKYDLRQIPIDFISGSAHKFYAPKGCGFVYINHQHHLEPLVHGGAQERNMRAGTENLYGIGTMAFALNYCYENFDERIKKLNELKTHFIKSLSNAVPSVYFNSPDLNGSSKIVNVQFPYYEGVELLNILFDIEGLSVSSGSACSSGSEKGSHVISEIRPQDKGKAVRFSFAHFNTADEIDRSIAIVAKCVSGKYR